jgi:hypothetical protein
MAACRSDFKLDAGGKPQRVDRDKRRQKYFDFSDKFIKLLFRDH